MLARLFGFINARAKVSVESSKIAVCEHESSIGSERERNKGRYLLRTVLRRFLYCGKVVCGV